MDNSCALDKLKDLLSVDYFHIIFGIVLMRVLDNIYGSWSYNIFRCGRDHNQHDTIFQIETETRTTTKTSKNAAEEEKLWMEQR